MEDASKRREFSHREEETAKHTLPFDPFPRHKLKWLSLPVLAAPFWGRPQRSRESADAESSKQGNPADSKPCIRLRGYVFDGGISMYAVIRAGGKQYRVAPGDVIRVESQGTGTDGKIEFSDVLAVSAEAGQIGVPKSGAQVTGEIVEQGREKKILVFHYKRKKQYKKLRGHRQNYTAVRIVEIAFDGQKFKAPELEKKVPKVKKAAPVETAEVKTGRTPAAHKKAAAKKPAHKPTHKKAVPKRKK
jgi:large subunit ribosomal protein L21